MKGIKIIKNGDDLNFPKKGNKVKVHYDMYLSDGTKIDSSRDEGVPFEFRLGKGEVISIWEEMIPEMSLGEKIEFTCKPEQVYEKRKLDMGSNMKIVFRVELINLN